MLACARKTRAQKAAQLVAINTSGLLEMPLNDLIGGKYELAAIGRKIAVGALRTLYPARTANQARIAAQLGLSPKTVSKIMIQLEGWKGMNLYTDLFAKIEAVTEQTESMLKGTPDDRAEPYTHTAA